MLLDLAAVTQVLQPRTVRYDLSKFSVVGSFVTDNPVMMVRADTGVGDFADLKTKPIIVGASGKGSQTYVHPALLKEVLGANLKIVTGYRGSADISLALERGEVQAQSATWVSWQARHTDWIKQRQIIPIVQVGLKKEPDLPDVPLMLELATNGRRPAGARVDVVGLADRPRAVCAAGRAGRADCRACATPSTRWSRIADFLEAAAKRKLVVRPTPGPEVQAIIQKVVSYSPDVIERARAVSGVKE